MVVGTLSRGLFSGAGLLSELTLSSPELARKLFSDCDEEGSTVRCFLRLTDPTTQLSASSSQGRIPPK